VVSSSLIDAVKMVSPRYRRWKRLLAGLTFDPDGLSRPVERPGERDFVICGCPRTGTSFLSAMLYQPPSVVTVMEPWDGMRLPPAELFASLRGEIEGSGRMTRGRLNVGALFGDGRVEWGRDGEFPHPIRVGDGYVLGVKWPAFWRYLELLPDTKFLVCLRDPVEVVASLRSAGGRIAEGLDYDIPFNRRMNDELRAATRDAALRRVLLYDYVNSRLLPYLGSANVFVVRYERWFDENDALLSEIGGFLGLDLGPGPAAIRPGEPVRDPDVEELVRAHCSTSEALGYPLPGATA